MDPYNNVIKLLRRFSLSNKDFLVSFWRSSKIMDSVRSNTSCIINWKKSGWTLITALNNREFPHETIRLQHFNFTYELIIRTAYWCRETKSFLNNVSVINIACLAFQNLHQQISKKSHFNFYFIIISNQTWLIVSWLPCLCHVIGPLNLNIEGQKPSLIIFKTCMSSNCSSFILR